MSQGVVRPKNTATDSKQINFTPAREGPCSLLLTMTLEEATDVISKIRHAIVQTSGTDAHVQIELVGELAESVPPA